MRRNISLAASLGLLLAMALPASAAVEAGPPCADIDNLVATYDGTDGGFDADMPDQFGLILKAPSCARYMYAIYVFNEAADTVPILTQTWVGDGTTAAFGITHQLTTAEDPDGDVYVYAESWFGSGGGKRVTLDRAPDSGFFVSTPDGPTPGTGVKAG